MNNVTTFMKFKVRVTENDTALNNPHDACHDPQTPDTPKLIFRFPYLAQTNGGGTFLIPYFISLVLIGLPLVLTELSLGQRLREGAIGSYKKFHPAFQ